jgi:large subunit ribosomal protein L9
MKVILIKDVARLGRKSEIKEVPDGHAINFLIPRKLAIIATPESIKRHGVEMKKQTEQKVQIQKSFEETLAKLKHETITYKVDANAQGHLYKGVNAEDIAKYLTALNYAITKQHVVLEHPLKEVGTYEISLVQGTLKGSCTLLIVTK